MQDAATQPPTPPPDPSGGATAVFPGGSVRLEGLPGSPQEIRGLRERRDILRDQLERATNRRSELIGELDGTGNPEARTGLQQRLALLDERILQIERDQAATEQLLSNAPAEILAQAREPVRQSGASDEDFAGFWFFGFAVGVVLTLVIGRWRRRRRRKHATATVVEDPRIERLNQAVDAIAEEVERIGEGQRFVTQLLAERKQQAALPKID